MKRGFRASPYSVLLTGTRRRCIVEEKDRTWYNDVAAETQKDEDEGEGEGEGDGDSGDEGRG